MIVDRCTADATMGATTGSWSGASTVVAASYERVSTRHQGRYGFSLGAQHQSLEDFARSLVKGLVLEEQLKKYGVRVVYQRVPVEDSPEGRLLKNQLFSFAEYEREKFALRSTMGRRQKARTGLVVGGGLPPYGYRFTFQTLDNGKRRVCGLEPDPIT